MYEGERGEFINMISLMIQMRLARNERKKDANTKLKL